MNILIAKKNREVKVGQASCESIARDLVIEICSCHSQYLSSSEDAAIVVLQAITEILAVSRNLKPDEFHFFESVKNGLTDRDRKILLSWALDRLTLDAQMFDSVEALGKCWERLYGFISDRGEPRSLHDSNAKRDHGVYYTPSELANFLVELTLDPILANVHSPQELLALRLLDPAVGVGYFLLAAHRKILSRAKNLPGFSKNKRYSAVLATSCLYGVDRDPIAAAVTRISLWLEVRDPQLQAKHFRNIRNGDALVSIHGSTPQALKSLKELEHSGFRSFEWRTAFSEIFENTSNPGFHVIVSNPPWGKVKSEAREFFARIHPHSLDKQGYQHKAFINSEQVNSVDRVAYANDTRILKAYLELLRATPSYSPVFGGAGDVDYYTLFVQRIRQLLRFDGRMGVLIPGGFLRAAGTAALRRTFFNEGETEHILEFENRDRLFAIHGMFKFILWTYSRGAKHGIKTAIFGLRGVKEAREALQTRQRVVSFSKNLLLKTSKKWLALPELRSAREQQLFSKLHSIHPPLGENDSSWNVKFVRELDMTNDSGSFIDASSVTDARTSMLPVYEGRLVQQFDHAAKAYLGGQGRRAIWTTLPYGKKSIRPHYFVSDAELSVRRVRAGFCDITGSANERTVLAALIPELAICGNKVPICEFDHDDIRLHLIWIAAANSFVIDWLVRRRITTTLNFFHWKQIPFPRIRPKSNLGKKLVLASAELSFISDGRNPTSKSLEKLLQTSGTPTIELNASERASRRANIDALMAAQFELTVEDFVQLLSDFNSLDRGQPKICAEPVPHRRYKSTVTRDFCLSYYCTLMNVDVDSIDVPWKEPSDRRSLTERLTAALNAGQIPYVPSQLAKSMFI